MHLSEAQNLIPKTYTLNPKTLPHLVHAWYMRAIQVTFGPNPKQALLRGVQD